MTKQKEQALVVSQEQLADGIFSMWIQTKAAETAKPGQFISMYTNDGSKLLPRPISICEIDAVNGRLRVVYRVTGENTGTEQFSKLEAGDTIPVVGPLGNGFPYEKAAGKKVFLYEKGLSGEQFRAVLKKAQEERANGTRVAVAQMNKNKKFQKEQLAKDGYEEIVEFYKDSLK